MNSTIARRLALPLLSAGILAGASLGLAGAASAADGTPEPRPSAIATPQDHAKSAAEAGAGRLWHRHHTSLIDSQIPADVPQLRP